MTRWLWLLALVSLAPINHSKTYGFDPRNWTVICMHAPYDEHGRFDASTWQAIQEEGWETLQGEQLVSKINQQCQQFKGFVVP